MLMWLQKYEWVPRNATGYRPARFLWTDVTGCGTSEAPAQEGVYELRSPGWISTIGGVMLSTLGHVHDGESVNQLVRRY
jgi:hypothetical protein